MVDLNGLKRSLELVESRGGFRLQTQSIQILIGEVANYVKQIAEEEALSHRTSELEREARMKPETPEEEAKLREINEMLMQAKNVKRDIEEKKRALRTLRSEVEQLLSEIRKIV